MRDGPAVRARRRCRRVYEANEVGDRRSFDVVAHLGGSARGAEGVQLDSLLAVPGVDARHTKASPGLFGPETDLGDLGSLWLGQVGGFSKRRARVERRRGLLVAYDSSLAFCWSYSSGLITP